MAELVLITNYKVTCHKCGKNISQGFYFSNSEGDLRCKRCQGPSKIEAMMEQKRGLSIFGTDSDRQIKALKDEKAALQNKIKGLEENYAKAQSSIAENLRLLNDNRILYDQVCDRNKFLNEEVATQKRIRQNQVVELSKECENLRAEIERKTAELESRYAAELEHERKLHEEKVLEIDSRYRTEIADIRRKDSSELQQLMKTLNQEKNELKELTETLKASESKNAYLESEYRRSQSLQTREIVSMFLEFMSGIYNASLDMKDAETLSGMIQARAEKVIMMAQSYGIDIHRTDRGEPVRDGRVDIDTKATDDPELDGKVIKCRNFGCSFAGDVETEIPEKVTVWNYVPPVREEPVTEDHHEATVSEDEKTAETVPVPDTEDAPAVPAEVAKSEEVPVETASEQETPAGGDTSGNLENKE